MKTIIVKLAWFAVTAATIVGLVGAMRSHRWCKAVDEYGYPEPGNPGVSPWSVRYTDGDGDVITESHYAAAKRIAATDGANSGVVAEANKLLVAGAAVLVFGGLAVLALLLVMVGTVCYLPITKRVSLTGLASLLLVVAAIAAFLFLGVLAHQPAFATVAFFVSVVAGLISAGGLKRHVLVAPRVRLPRARAAIAI